MKNMDLTEQIKIFLKKSGMTQFEFAYGIGAAIATVNRWLMGHSKISKVYEKTVIEFMKKNKPA